MTPEAVATRTVWKFAVFPTATVMMPDKARLLLVASQRDATLGDQVCVWAEVDPTALRVERTFAVFGTGHPVPENGRHVGSCLMAGGALVWHVYELVGSRLGAEDAG